MSLSLYIILSVSLLIGVIFLMLARSTKEEKVSLDPPKVRGGTLFVPTVKHHVKIDPPPIMQSRLVAEELFVGYTLPGFARRGTPPDSASPAVAVPSPGPGPLPTAGSSEVDAEESKAKELEAEASSLLDDPRNAEKIKAEATSAASALLRYTDEIGNTYARDSEEETSLDLLFVTEVITKPSVSANPDLDPSNLGSGENLSFKRNDALKSFLSQTEVFDLYESIMEQVYILLDDDPDRDELVEFTRQVEKRGLKAEVKNLLMTTFYKEQPEVAEGEFRAESILLSPVQEMEGFMS